MKAMLRFVLFSGWLMFRATLHHLHFTPAGYRETRYGLKMLSILGYKTDAAK
jgi:hypothetical protein